VSNETVRRCTFRRTA